MRHFVGPDRPDLMRLQGLDGNRTSVECNKLYFKGFRF